jgi:cell wall-associated NlpC family hydrolase
VTQKQIVAQAASYIGTPWLHQGRTRDGIDCVGLIIAVLTSCGWVPREPEQVFLAGYERVADSEYVLQAMRGEGQEIDAIAELQEGDVVVFRPRAHEFAQHCGIISRVRPDGARYFIHADTEAGEVVEYRLVLTYREQFVAGFRVWEEELNQHG